MNAPRHDPEEIKAALNALHEVLTRQHSLRQQADALRRQAFQLESVIGPAREKASKLLRQEGGTVIHEGRTWKVNSHGAVSFEDAGVNLDAISNVQRHEPTELHLTPPASEKAA